MSQELILENVAIYLDGQPLVSVDTQIAPGEILTLMGPSGVGKSTLLAYIAGFLAPSFTAHGQIRLNGQDLTKLPAHARRAGLLFQDPLLFPHLSVGGNLAFGLRDDARRSDARRNDARHDGGQHGDTKAQRRARIEAALADIGLANFYDRDPATLSGGQRSRVALMRVLLSEPRAMLLDEPFSKLDTALRDEMRRLVFDRVRESQLPTLMVTHDREDATAAGGRIIELEAFRL